MFKQSIQVHDIKFSEPTTTLIVGDLHGSLQNLMNIINIFHHRNYCLRNTCVIAVGDVVDRGAHSRELLNWFLSKEPLLQKFSVLGNHEQMFLKFAQRPQQHKEWLDYGGLETLNSYFPGLTKDQLLAAPKLWTRRLPKEHLQWLKNLPSVLSLGKSVIAHAGYNPSLTPEKQSPQQLIWGPCLSPEAEPLVRSAQTMFERIIHGHEITDAPPDPGSAIINLDSGAYREGSPLTGLAIDEHGNPVEILTTS